MAQGRTSTASRSVSSSGETRIGAGTRVRGRVAGEGDLVVSGSVDGDITVTGALRIEEGASARSTVDAESVSVDGALTGDVVAKGEVRIGAGAEVRGDLRAEHFVIEEGARFAGNLDCDFDLPAGLGGSSNGRRGG